MIATAFIVIIKHNKTIMAPEARSTNAGSPLTVQLYICTGSAVDGSKTPSGDSAGYSRTKATIPINSKGAVSPSAWARPRITPVKIPGAAEGKT